MPYRDVYVCQNIQCCDQGHYDQIDSWCEELIDICLTSDHVFPQAKSSIKSKPGWSEHVKPYKDECNFWYQIWKSFGRPRAGTVYDCWREAKRQYMYSVRRIKRKENALRMEKLSECISQNKSRDFFKELKKMKPKREAPCINSLANSTEIVEHFAQKYQELYNSAPSNVDFIYEYINKQLSSGNACIGNATFDTEIIKRAVKSLNLDKNDGDKGYMSNHLIYASHM
jgi:hypothetical protein